MGTDQRRMILMLALVAAVVLAIIGVLYLAGDFIPSGKHTKHAILAFALAVGALVVANFNRPGAAARI
jgi:hypothetical protein